MPWITDTADGCVIAVKATPRASKTELRGIENDCLCVRLQAPPNDGKANAALCEFLAETFRLPKRGVVILGGETSRHKRVLLRGAKSGQIVAGTDFQQPPPKLISAPGL